MGATTWECLDCDGQGRRLIKKRLLFRRYGPCSTCNGTGRVEAVAP